MEARDKVTGAAVYAADVRHDSQFEGVILRSPHAHARVVSVNLDPARALPGVRAAVEKRCEDRVVRYVGQEVAGVAAAAGRRPIRRSASSSSTSRFRPRSARKRPAGGRTHGLQRTPQEAAELRGGARRRPAGTGTCAGRRGPFRSGAARRVD